MARALFVCLPFHLLSPKQASKGCTVCRAAGERTKASYCTIVNKAVNLFLVWLVCLSSVWSGSGLCSLSGRLQKS